MSESPAGEDRQSPGERSVNVALEGFAWEAVEQQSAHMGVSVEDFVAFSVLYYLADVDSGRVARRISRSPYTDSSP
jgi:hypothetical protein